MFACCFPSAKSILTAVPPSHLPTASANACAEASANACAEASANACAEASANATAEKKNGLKAAEAVSTSEITACNAAAMTFSSTEVANKLDEAKVVAANLEAAISSANAVTDSLNFTVAAAIANTGVVPVPAEDEEESDAIITEFSDTDEEVVPQPAPVAEKL
jgi:hypothetical protein